MGEIINFSEINKNRQGKTYSTNEIHEDREDARMEAKRKNFQEELRKGVKPIQLVQIQKNEEVKSLAEIETNGQRRTRRANTTHKRKIKNKPNKNKMSLHGNKKIALALATILALGGIGGGAAYAISQEIEANSPITLEQAQENGTSTEKLNIDENTLQTIQELQERLESNDIDTKELTHITEDLCSLQFDVIKSKLSSPLNIPVDEIRVFSNVDKYNGKDETTETIELQNNRRIFESQLPSEVETHIRNIARTQTNSTNIKKR